MDNVATFQGTHVFFEGVRRISFNDSEFKGKEKGLAMLISEAQQGGVVFALNFERIGIESCSFYGNRALGEGGVLYLRNEEIGGSNLSIISSNFTDN